MNTCKQIQPLLIDFVDKILDLEKTQWVKQHLENCISCREETDKLVTLFDEMNKIENEIPDEKLTLHFQAMLEAEKEKSGKLVGMVPSHKKNWFYSNLGQIAASISILIAGILIGYLFNGSNDSGYEVAEIKKEMNSMKEMLMLSKLEQPIASERMIATSYLSQEITPDATVLNALIKTMNSDQNTNVRMAAMNALSHFKSQALVADAMVESLSIQTDPIIQISLINILVEMNDTRAVDKMKQIIDNNSTNESVKKLAEEGILTLI